MYTKKGIILIIIIVILSIAIIGGVSAFVILKTDLFKSNKTLFYKYLGEELQQISELKSDKILANMEAEKTKSNSKDGKLSFSYSDPNSQKLTEVLEKTEVFINSKKNIEENKSSTKIDIQNDGNNIFTAEMRVDDGIYGITSPDVLNAFLGIENKDLDKLFSRLNISYSDSMQSSVQIENFSEIFKFTEQEQNAMKNLFTRTIDSILDNGKYVKNKKQKVTKDSATYDATEYYISLTQSEVKDLFITFLNNLKSDSIVLNSIATRAKIIGLGTGYTDVNSLSANIGEYISTITNLAANDEELLKISVYTSKGKCIQTKIQTYDETGFGQYILEISAEGANLQAKLSTVENNIATLKLSKIDNSDGTNYNIVVSNDSNLTLDIYFENMGNANSNNIKNKMNLTYSYENISFGITYEDKVVFEENSNIEGLRDNNCVIINNYDKDSVQSFLISIREKLLTVYAQKLEQLGLSVDYTLESIEQQAEMERNEFNEEQQRAEQELNNAAQSLQGLNLSDEEKKSYNLNIENYLGENKNGTDVNSIVDTAMSLITTYPERNIVFIFEDEEYSYSTMTTLKTKIKDTSKYKIIGEKNESTGLYNKITITEIKEDSNQ